MPDLATIASDVPTGVASTVLARNAGNTAYVTQSYSPSDFTSLVVNDSARFDGTNWINIKHNLVATAPPDADDDTTEGYAIGSIWIDVTNDAHHVCVDTTDGAAVWISSATLYSPVIDFIDDSAGDHVLGFNGGGGDAAYVTVANGASALVGVAGTAANPTLGFITKGNGAFAVLNPSGQNAFRVIPASVSTNYLTVTTVAASNPVVVAAAGTNSGLNFTTTGTGIVAVAADEVVTLVATQTLTNKVIDGSQLVADSVANAKLADMAAWTLKLRNNGSSGVPQDVGITSLAVEASPAAGDFLMLELADGSLAYADVDNLPGGGGGSSTFSGLTDTPGSITARQLVIGNDAGTDLAFTATPQILNIRDDTVDTRVLSFAAGATAPNYLQVLVSGGASAQPVLQVRNDTPPTTPVGILFRDTSSDPMLTLRSETSAVNYIGIRSGATGNDPIISTEGEAGRGLTIHDGDGAISLSVASGVPGGTAVNYLEITNESTGVHPGIAAMSTLSEASGIRLTDKDNQEILHVRSQASADSYLTLWNAVASVPIFRCTSPAVSAIGFRFDDSNSAQMLQLGAVANGATPNVNYLQVTSNITGGDVIVGASGEANRGVNFRVDNITENVLTLSHGDDATGAIYFEMLNAGAGNPPRMKTAGGTDLGMLFEDSQGDAILELKGLSGTLTTHIGITPGISSGAPIISAEGGSNRGIFFKSSDDDEIVWMSAVASATTSFRFQNGATGTRPIIASRGEADIGIEFRNSEEEVTLRVDPIDAGVNYLRIRNSATGNSVHMNAAGEADIGFNLRDSNDNAILDLQPTAGAAVNYVRIQNQVAANPAVIRAAGGSDKGLIFRDSNAKVMVEMASEVNAANYIKIQNKVAGAVAEISSGGTADLGMQFRDSSGLRLLNLAAVNSSANFFVMTQGATGVMPSLRSNGEADIGMMFLDSNNNELLRLTTGDTSAADFLGLVADTGLVQLNAVGDSANVTLELASRGAGDINLNTGTGGTVVLDNISMPEDAPADGEVLTILDDGATPITTHWLAPAGSGDMLISVYDAAGVSEQLVGLTATQTLSNKTLTLPQINDTSLDHQYVFAVSELVADRTVTLPLLTTADTFVFAAHAETLTNKSIDLTDNTLTGTSAELATAISDETGSGLLVFGTSPTMSTNIVLEQSSFNYTLTWSDPSSSRQILINDPGATDAFVFQNMTQTLEGKSIDLADNTLTGTAAQFNTAVTDDTFALFSDSLDVFAATTSAELAGVISDETGTGLLVFGTSPTIATPSLTLKGNTVTVGTTGLGSSNEVVFADAVGGNITLNLPAASSNAGRRYYIKKIDSSSNSVTVDGNASETIDGATTVSTTTQYSGWTILCDGSNWSVVAIPILGASIAFNDLDFTGSSLSSIINNAVTDLSTYATTSGTGTVAIKSTITAPLENELLAYSAGANWINKTFSELGLAVDGGAHHDGFSDFLATEHVDWAASDATNIHVDNLPGLASAQFWVGNGPGVAVPVSMSGDATMDNTGAVTVTGGDNTLDDAYDQGGAGAGRTINVDSGLPVLFSAGSATMDIFALHESGDANAGIIFHLVSGEARMDMGPGGATAPDVSIRRGSAAGILDVSSILNAATGFRVADGAASGNVLRGNGTNFVSATLAAADLSNGTTGSGGGVVLATAPTLASPVLVTPTIAAAGWASANHTHAGASTGGTIAISDTTGTLAETRGGTNQTTYATGDILYASGANTLTKLTIGSGADVLTVSGGVPIWSAPGGGSAHDLLSATHTDTLAAAVSRGSIIVGNATPAWSELTIGGSATVLRSDGTDAAWTSLVEADISNLGTLAAMVADDLSVFAATTSAQLAGVISDETGSGLLCFGTSPVLTTPQINDTSSDHQYVFAVSELAADRTVALPLLAGNDIFVFEAFAQTLTNKTIAAGSNTITGLAASDLSDGIPNTRTITVAATSNETSVAEGAQDLSANRTFTVGLADNPTIPGTVGVILPIKTDTGDPAGSEGRIYYNTFSNKFRAYEGAAWADLVGAGSHTHTLADVTDSGALAALATVDTTEIDDDAVTYAKIQNVVADDVFLGRISGAGGVVEELTAANAKTILALSASDLSDGVPDTRTITVAGTSNEIDSSAGAQDFSANRTWTIGLSDNPTVPGTYMTVPTKADPDPTGADGRVYYNTTANELRFSENTTWRRAIFEGGAFHDGFSDHVANEHIDWTSATASLSTSGTLTTSHASGLITDDITERTVAAGVTIDGLLIKDSGIPEAAVTAHEGAITHDNLTGVSANEHLDWTSSVGTIHTGNYIEGGAGTDTTAIHDDTASEISAVTLKGTPVSGDFLLIEDSDAGNAKKRVTVGSLPAGSEANDLETDGAAGIATTEIFVGNAAGAGVYAALSGDVTMDNTGAVTIAADSVTYDMMQDVSATDRFLGRDTAGAGTVEEITVAAALTMLNVEAGADVTDTANVTSAGALMDSELTDISGIKTLTVVDNTTITTFAATFLDDTTQGAVQTTLDVDPAGTDNSTDVTLAGTPDYITISGQVITRNQVVLTTDVTGTLPVANGGTGLSTARPLTKSFEVIDPVATDDLGMFFTPVAITVTATHTYITGTTNVVFNIGHASTRTGTQLDVFTGDITLTSTAGQTNNSGFNDATIPANSWVWCEVVSVSGTPTRFHVTLEYTED